MKILVTGTEGYIGARLAPLLLAQGHAVAGLDTGYYRDGWLFSPAAQPYLTPRTIVKDLRRIEVADPEGFDAVVHLAEVSARAAGTIEMSPETFAFRAFTRVKQLRYLMRTRQLDDDLYGVG